MKTLQRIGLLLVIINCIAYWETSSEIFRYIYLFFEFSGCVLFIQED
jgi:hypothetical protein